MGQRRGLGVSKEKPMYVKEIDPKTNRVVIANKEEIKCTEIIVRGTNYLTKLPNSNIKVRVRSSGKFLDANIEITKDSEAIVKLETPETAVSPGQACVFYSEDSMGLRLLGGGWIYSTK